MSRLFVSEYNSEEKLKSKDAFSIPSMDIFRKNNDILMSGMDALTMAMADDGDGVVLRTQLSDDYLGFWNDNICKLSVYTPENASRFPGKSIYQLLSEDEKMSDFIKNSNIENYAIVPEYYDMCTTIGIDALDIPLETVRKINSKSYSNSLKYKLDLPAKGTAVYSIDEFEKTALEMIQKYGKVLLKESMGVSGKGMILLESSSMVQSLVRSFTKQKEKGKRIFDFVLEPYLNKTMDFSCQMQIDKTGRVFINGYQKNYSKGFAYNGTEELSSEEYDLVKASDYENICMAVGNELYKEGYFGYACIDSMFVNERELIPLVEINPRMSLARYNLKMSEKLKNHCRFTYGEITPAKGYTADNLLKDLSNKGILYDAKRNTGIIPLAPNTWSHATDAGIRGRIYYMIVYGSEGEYEKIYDSWLGHCTGCLCSGT